MVVVGIVGQGRFGCEWGTEQFRLEVQMKMENKDEMVLHCLIMTQCSQNIRGGMELRL